MREDWEECLLIEGCDIHDNLRKPINSKERNVRINGKSEDQLYPYYGATGQVGFIDDYLTDGVYVLIGEDAAPFLDYSKDVAYQIFGKTWVNNHAHILKSKFNNEFLLHYLNNFNYKDYVSGTTRLKLTQGRLKQIPIKIAPLPEQRAIVAKIKELFSDLDKGIADLKKAQDQLKVYRQAVLKKAFEGELTKEWREQQTDLPTADELLAQIKEERQKHYEQQIENWKQAVKAWEENGKEGKKPTVPKRSKEKAPLTEVEKEDLFALHKGSSWRKIGEICSVKGGKRLPKGQSFSKEPTKYSYIMAGNLKNGTVTSEANYINKETYDALYHYRVNQGDAYITIVGACIGDAGVIPESHHLSILTENAAKIICTLSLSSKYLSFWLNSTLAQIRIKRSIFSMTLGKLALSRIEDIEFPLCSIEEQHQIVQEIESRLSVCDKVEESITESLEKAKALRQSILKKAFEGTLLSEEEIAACKAAPDYEPASVLLERIKNDKKK